MFHLIELDSDIAKIVEFLDSNRFCDGTVATLNRKLVIFTGKSSYRGEHVTREVLAKKIRLKGAIPMSGRGGGAATLLILGGLHPDVVFDRRNGRSKTLAYVDEAASRGHHVCVVDDGGLELLLDGKPARCIENDRLDRLKKPN